MITTACTTVEHVIIKKSICFISFAQYYQKKTHSEVWVRVVFFLFLSFLFSFQQQSIKLIKCDSIHIYNFYKGFLFLNLVLLNFLLIKES